MYYSNIVLYNVCHVHDEKAQPVYMYMQRPPVQSRVAAGFSWFSKNIPKPFLMYTIACMLCSVAP